MIRSLARSTGAVLLGLMVAAALVIAIEAFSAVVHPFPPGADPTDLEVCRAHVAAYPQWVLAVVVPLWAVTVFLAAWIATRLGTGRHPAHGIAVGGVLYLAVIFNMWMLPYPAWFEAANYVTFPVAILAAAKLGSAGRSRQHEGPPVPEGPGESGPDQPTPSPPDRPA